MNPCSCLGGPEKAKHQNVLDLYGDIDHKVGLQVLSTVFWIRTVVTIVLCIFLTMYSLDHRNPNTDEQTGPCCVV